MTTCTHWLFAVLTLFGGLKNDSSSDGLLDTFLDSIDEASKLQEQIIVAQRFPFVQSVPPYTVCLERKHQAYIFKQANPTNLQNLVVCKHILHTTSSDTRRQSTWNNFMITLYTMIQATLLLVNRCIVHLIPQRVQLHN